MSFKRTNALWWAAAIAWGFAAAGVWAWTTAYEFTTYDASRQPTRQPWPAGSGIELADDRPTLLYFLHPRCPCSRASTRELERVLTGPWLSEARRPKVVVVATLPSDSPAGWRDTGLVRRASSLPRAEVVWDTGGREATRFGVVTSGAVRLFRQDGVLLFAGGVTASRGHEGDNAGGDRVRALLAQESPTPRPSTPAFGCRLCIEAQPPDRVEARRVRPPVADAPTGGARR